MDKPLLMQWLSTVRAQAEAARIEIIIQSQLVAGLEQESREIESAKLQLQQAKMTEQKLLLHLAWILDELDRPITSKSPPGADENQNPAGDVKPAGP